MSSLAATPASPFPPLGADVPSRGNALTMGVARFALSRLGWRFEGSLPDLRKFVIIVAPHTSNWDFVLGVLALFALGLRVTFLGKHTLFRWPLGAFMRWLGGVPVDRATPHHVVEQTIDHFRQASHLVLALSPEGTRRKLAKWRSGFYFIALGAGVPIVPVALDYHDHAFRIFRPFTPTGNQENDVARLGTHFHAQMGRHPDRY